MPQSDSPLFTVFCDETGNSGSRFFSPEQPVYAEGGWYVREDQRAGLERAIVELEKDYGYNPQTKGTRLKAILLPAKNPPTCGSTPSVMESGPSFWLMASIVSIALSVLIVA